MQERLADKAEALSASRRACQRLVPPGGWGGSPAHENRGVRHHSRAGAAPADHLGRLPGQGHIPAGVGWSAHKDRPIGNARSTKPSQIAVDTASFSLAAPTVPTGATERRSKRSERSSIFPGSVSTHPILDCGEKRGRQSKIGSGRHVRSPLSEVARSNLNEW